MTSFMLATVVVVMAMATPARAETPPRCPSGQGFVSASRVGTDEISDGRGLGTVTIGADLSDVERAWGAPAQCVPSGGGWTMTYVLAGDSSGRSAIMSVVMQQTSVKGLIVLVPFRGGAGAAPLRTSRGAGFGLSPARVEQIYGAPDTGMQDFLVYAAQGIAFQLIDRAVGGIFVFKPGALPDWLTP